MLSTEALAGKTVVALSAGGAHSLALCSDGTMAAWGSNSRGQLGSSMFQQGGAGEDALDNYSEVTQNFTVIATQEDWRTFYFGTTQNAGDAADLADPDGDGANNQFEYVAGLTPTNNQSRFNLRVELVAGRPEQKAIVFSPLVAGRTYTVKYKLRLTDVTWTPLTDIATSDSGNERTVTDLSAGDGSRIYQVEITPP